MEPLTESQIRSSIVNATKGEASRAALPDLAEVRWDRLDFLGWRDPRSEQVSWVVSWLDGEPVGFQLRAPGAGKRKAGLCIWCEEVNDLNEVTLYVAPRAGAKGRKGDSIGSLVCSDFSCSRNVRKVPPFHEVGSRDPEARAVVVERKVAALRGRFEAFVRELVSA